ncbi:hypothetical protein [Lacrimispora sp.]|uniref:hypothetical protein n=1 Tax=Lacrimispora sp. TaxID=2719234 RepID=UPI0028AC88C8|nr:hypothetical protein [Lacrimispora sp.]
MSNTKFCKHCGEVIDVDCVVCPKCGKQVEQLSASKDNPIIINNTASSSSSASAVNNYATSKKPLPWYLKWFWIFILGCFTGGIYWIVGFVLRVSWKSKN